MKYVPLVVAAGVILAIIAHSWIVRDSPPSNALIGAMLVLVLAPLASRINVVGLIDFRKSVDRLDGELTEARREIATVATNVQSLQLGFSAAVSSPQDQVVNLNLGEAIDRSSIEHRADVVAEDVLQQVDAQDAFVLSPAFRLRWFLADRLIVAIGQITAALFMAYGHVEVTKNGRGENDSSNALELSLADFIAYFRNNRSLRPMRPENSTDEEDMDYLRRLEDLSAYTVELEAELIGMLRERNQLLDPSNPGPDPDVIRAKIRESEMLRAHFMGWAFGLSTVLAMSLKTITDTTNALRGTSDLESQNIERTKAPNGN